VKVRARLLFGILPQAFGLVWRAAPRHTIINATLTVIQGLTPALTLTLTKTIVDSVVHAAYTHTHAEVLHVLLLIVAWLATQIFTSLLQSLANFFNNLQSDLLNNYVNVELIKKANSLDISYFENAQFYDKLENARREAGYRPNQMIGQMFGLLRNVITLISVIGVLAVLSWWLVALVVLVAIPSFVYQTKLGGRFFALLSKRAPEQRKLNYLTGLLTTDVSVKELRIFGLHDTLLERYQQIFAKFYKENQELATRRIISQFAVSALAIVAASSTYVYVALQVIAGRITIGGLTLYYQAFQQSQQATTAILNGIGSMYENSLFLNNLFEFLAYAPQLPVCPNPTPMPTPMRGGIVFDHVSFKYPGTEKWVLEDISFAIRPGESLALVGSNGAGKTTLVKLLTRLYDPTMGQIMIDGSDIRAFDPAELRSRVGVIFQDYVKYQLSAGENIGFGRIEAIKDIARIERSAAEAGADAVIAALPQKYDTALGRGFAGGHELSIGQWQKVALARAFMRNADILILDEPTSSLDVQSEHEVFQTFNELREGKIAVLISHRFSTVRMASRIVVIENGRVIENGSHDELILRGGRYAELFGMQAAAYR